MKHSIRLAKITDLNQVMICITDAKSFLKSCGLTQWNGSNGYPDRSDLENDILNNHLFVCENDKEIMGVAAFLGVEPQYKKAYGHWLIDTDNYLTIHRVAVSNKYRGKGIATLLFEYAYQYAKNKGLDSIRVDTHIGNIPMQSLTKKLDFKPCGYVIYDYIEEEPKRLIFEKLVY